MHAKIVRDKTSRRSFGYGFVMFKKEADAANAIRLKNGALFYSKRLKVSYARPSSEDIKNCKLYVTDLPSEITTIEVQSLFSRVRMYIIIPRAFLLL